MGRELVAALIAEAGASGAERIELETSAGWREAVALYRSCGFTLTHVEEGAFGPDAYFALEL